jgi:hypothetical protein
MISLTIIDPPGAIQESADAADTRHLPWHCRIQRTHEHFIKPECVGAVLPRHHPD